MKKPFTPVTHPLIRDPNGQILIWQITFWRKPFSYVKEEGKSEKPFFLYYAIAAANVPRTPHPRFVGNFRNGDLEEMLLSKAGLDRRGSVIKQLESLGIMEYVESYFQVIMGLVLNDGVITTMR